jgi:hypothetical protein
LTPATLERLRWEMVALCNRALILDQVDFADTAAVRASLGRVHAQVNIGVEHLCAQQPQLLVPLLTDRSLLSIAQVGFSLAMRLKQRALYFQTHLQRAAGVRRALPGCVRSVIDGLLQTWHPQFFLGLEVPGEMAYREFLHLRDIQDVDAILRSIERDPAYCLAQSAA